MLFKDFVLLCRRLENIGSRLGKVGLLVDFFKKATPEEARVAAYLLTGKLFPETKGRKLGIGPATLFRVLRSVSGTITLFEELRPLTLLEVYRQLEKIASIEGESSKSRREKLLKGLFVSLSRDEREFLARFITGEVRVGVNDGIIIEAISKLTATPLDLVKKAYMSIGDIGELTYTAIKEGGKGIRQARIQLFRPVKPMLAQMANDIKQALVECGGKVAVEFKYDGIRLQIHKKGDVVKLYTRRLTDVTECLPDVVDLVRKHVHASEVILDSEAIGFKDGKPLRFQDLVRRLRRRQDVTRMLKEIPLRVKVFDILYVDGQSLVDKPYLERMKILESIVDREILVDHIITDNVNEAYEFFKKAEELGYEGVMVKNLLSPYTPGVREKYWLKVKTVQTLDLVIVAAEWGHGRRHKWLSDFHLAVYDEKTGRFLEVGKTFKGLTDKEFDEITRRLLELKVEDLGWMIKVKPQIVVEVAFNEIQQSPKYKSGYALRFARIVRIRYDKSPYDATTLDELKKLYEEQFKYKAKIETKVKEKKATYSTGMTKLGILHKMEEMFKNSEGKR